MMNKETKGYELYPTFTELVQRVPYWFEKGTKEEKELATAIIDRMARISDKVMSVALGGDPKKKAKNYEEAIQLLTK